MLTGNTISIFSSATDYLPTRSPFPYEKWSGWVVNFKARTLKPRREMGFSEFF